MDCSKLTRTWDMLRPSGVVVNHVGRPNLKIYLPFSITEYEIFGFVIVKSCHYFNVNPSS